MAGEMGSVEEPKWNCVEMHENCSRNESQMQEIFEIKGGTGFACAGKRGFAGRVG